MLNRGNSYKNCDVILDGNEYVNCKFENVTFVFSATGPVTLSGCDIGPHQWRFSGPAENTIKFVRAMHQMGDTGLLDLLNKEIKRA